MTGARRSKSQRGRQPQALSEKTSREYMAMMRAVQALEKAFTSPAPKRERVWMQRTRRGLATVVGFIQEHCESAESGDGLLTEVEARLGRPRELSQARREHKQLLREAVGLLTALDEYGLASALPYHDIRRRAAQLTAGFRLHHGEGFPEESEPADGDHDSGDGGIIDQRTPAPQSGRSR